MTRVVFFTRADGGLNGFEADGHSGYARSGSDIVCAAVSALAQAAVGGIERVANAPAEVIRNDESGYLKLVISDAATDIQLRDSRILLDTLEMALKTISNDYPNNVRVILRERR